MKSITRIKLQNFKKFKTFDVTFHESRNIIIGDNESGKSTILTAIDLVLNGSRNKLENIGLSNLFNKDCITEFFAGDKTIANLPKLFAEISMNELSNFETHGANHTGGGACDGLKLECEPNLNLSSEIREILAQTGNNFPFEYYDISFKTFADVSYTSYRKFVKSVMLDSSQINNDYATKEYIKTMFYSFSEGAEPTKLENDYRAIKNDFADQKLNILNSRITDYAFQIRSGPKANLQTDLAISEGGINIENRGKGRQCFIKTEFALSRQDSDLDIILLEEPENHLSHQYMKKLINRIDDTNEKQIFIATHNDLISSRLDLRKSILLNSNSNTALKLNDLTEETAKFFMKAPDNNILQFILSKRVLLVEGNAEFILMEALYKKEKGQLLKDSNIHVISVGGLSFKRYLELANKLNIQCAVVTDNDGDYQKNCVEKYQDYVGVKVRIFAEENNTKKTFEPIFYESNEAICDELFGPRLNTRTVLEYMLANKAECAFQLLDKKFEDIDTPDYIKRAISWISQ
jgi:putative ATP-dependent endonuclease of OLD family